MYAILAPVPAILLQEALELHSSIVAFGSNAFEFFSSDEVKAEKGKIRVLIFASNTDASGPHPLYKPGYVTFNGTYEGFEPSVGGVHKFPEERPPSAKFDTPVGIFWRVSNLKKLEMALPLKQLKLPPLPGAEKLRKYSGNSPRGPLLIVDPNTI